MTVFWWWLVFSTLFGFGWVVRSLTFSSVPSSSMLFDLFSVGLEDLPTDVLIARARSVQTVADEITELLELIADELADRV